MAAKATVMHFRVETGEEVEEKADEFEAELIKLTNDFEWPGLWAIPRASRSIRDLVDSRYSRDAGLFFVGFVLAGLYLLAMLGGWDRVGTGAVVVVVGLASVALGLLSAHGLCASLGLAYTTMNDVIPFLAFGVGIDNIFGMAQAFAHTEGKGDAGHLLPTRFGLFLRQTGMALAITTLMEATAFAVGANTQLVFMRNFAVYSFLTILLVTFFMLTLFLGCFVLEQRRMDSRRYAVLCCFKVRITL